ncbi:hypothetical protein P3T73_14280 [Kiritimatiellota bacterium B12222]|nr:hypothetical protein P3T73_14280 [Kiritimatiellota bacterium B12222]
MGKLFDLIKALVVIALLGYGAYWGWQYFGGQDGGASGGKTYTSQKGNGAEGDEERGGFFGRFKKTKPEAEVEELTPLQMQNKELTQVAAQIFAPISGGNVNVANKLKSLWNLAEADFKSGDLTEQQAKVITALITELNNMATERNLYVGQIADARKITASSYDKGMDVKKKREFAEKELKRQWSDWANVNKNKLKPYFQALSAG